MAVPERLNSLPQELVDRRAEESNNGQEDQTDGCRDS
jgi:hypothetical protein